MLEEVWRPDLHHHPDYDPAMADVVNLNKARKTRGREQAKAKAAENRARFGQDKATRDKARKEAERIRQELDSKKLD